MKYDDFIRIRDEGIIPEDIHVLLQALLLDAAGDWDSAHRIARDEFTKQGYRVHAYLHRKEGDMSNATYWYNNAGMKTPQTSLEEEWESIARELIQIHQ